MSALCSHPVRAQILEVMGRHGVPVSPAQLARITGATLGTTAYHVQVLLAAELIEPAGEQRGVRGSVEHFYTLVDDSAGPDTARGLLGLCGALTVRHADGGGYSVSTELDDGARAELQALLDRLRPQVRQIAAASTARVRSRATEPAWVLRDPLQTFADNVRRARAALGVTQEEVAGVAGMDPSQFGRIERAQVDPSVRTAARIARALDVMLAELYEGVEAMPLE